MNLPKRYTVTAALPYANGPLHIGHMAGVYIPADIYARYLRLQGREVLFVCGSDEHGAAITLKARKEGRKPQEVVDQYHHMIASAFAEFGMSFDIYHRTSADIHHRTAQDFFTRLLEAGAFEVRESLQFYDEEAEQFLADRYITGICPNCGFENAYGDQCENCGRTLSPTELIEPRSTLSGSAPVLKETQHWYLPLNDHEQWLKQWIDEGMLDGKLQHDPSTWKKQVLGQCRSWIDGGLQPRAMTRDLDWGVKVPLPEAAGKVLYVWLDAPIGYITATKAWAEQQGSDWRPWWQAADTKLVHFLAKDNIVFHCIIFPALLKLHQGFILPDNVPANEFLNLEGRKISTSRNWAVWLHGYMEDFPGRQDELRYVLNAIAPEYRDSEFTWSDFQARVNNELVAILGNFVNRVLVLLHKFFDGKLPAAGSQPIGDATVFGQSAEEVAQLIEAYRFREAQQAVMNVARYGNKLLTEWEPWKLVKSDAAQAGSVLHFCAQLVAQLSIVARPFLPHTAQAICRMLRIDEWEWHRAAQADLLPAGHDLGQPELLFKRIEDEEVQQQVEKLHHMSLSSQAAAPKAEPIKPEVSFEDFSKMDIRTATILSAARVPKTDKLLQLTLDTGVDKRTVVSGIAQHFDPEELPGTEVCVLLNLAPRKIKGILSQGMILMAEDATGSLRFLQSPSSGNGATVS